MLSRRSFFNQTLSSSTLIALSSTVPGFLARSARAAELTPEGRVLVVIELNGGNDGINTVVPYRDEGYERHRSALRLPTRDLFKIDDRVGLHPALSNLARLLDEGKLAIVQGVGYPNPNRSHFQSLKVWHTARTDAVAAEGPGWIGRALDSRAESTASGPGAIFVGHTPPPGAVRGRRSAPIAIDRTADFLLGDDVAPRPGKPGSGADDELTAYIRRSALDAYTTADRMAAVTRSGAPGRPYPTTPLAGRLEQISRLVKAGAGARFYYALQGGYDTHASQLPAHTRLLGELSGAIGAFLDDLTAARLAERVAVLCFSEFGRRVSENGSAGTDHGTSGPVLLAGALVRPGLVASTPSLTDLDDGDLKVGVDFRRIYAAVLDGWLGLPAAAALGGAFEPLALFRPLSDGSSRERLR
jgi:uncharacterized protein (DUF1501 family)